MIKKLKILIAMMLGSIVGMSALAAEDTSYTTAVIVNNRAGAEYDSQLAVLEDLLAGKLSDQGFSIMSRDLIIDAARGINPASDDDFGSSLSDQLVDQSSALRLAQSMGADYILSSSITSLTKRKRNVNAYGVKLANYVYTLRLSYTVVDANGGGSVTGGVVTATKTEQNTVHSNEGFRVVAPDPSTPAAPAGSPAANADEGLMRATKRTVAVAYLDPNMEPILADLLDDATTQIASALRTKAAQNRIAAPKSKAGPVSITLNVETADLYIPDVQLGPENTVSIKDGKLAIAPLNVTVEVDGVAVGSAPGKISLRPGLSKLRLTREGYKTWERTINAREGQTLTIAMQMSPEGLARWEELTAFMNTLKNGAKLTDAQVQVLQGKAKMLQNSGFKVDTDQGITIQNGRDRSFFNW
ncbi:MAG: PEGA domain-containing protein [Opitutaceae bacterium]|nr:PEGA domain-containing protein [Opitutaceae bacterium]|tara:strand:- start:4376 stop:5617 length:1242 start_codon:yes stop_codon:yes gene_type:complete